MAHVDRERLNRLLGDPDLAWVLDRVRRRLELGQPMHGTITQRSATRGQQDAVARLFGRPLRTARGVSVSLDELDVLLRRSRVHEGGLAEAVVTLTGPVIVRADRVQREERAWAEAFAPIEATAAGRDELTAWLGHIRASGVVKRLVAGSPAAGQELLGALSTVVAALPTSGGESLSAFAARVTGQAHALDDGSPLGTLALGAARALAGLESPGPDESVAEARREAWAAVGVLCDELSSIVLTLGLPGDGSVTGRLLAPAQLAGEPIWLTLRQLVRNPPQWPRIGSVLIVENPSVIAHAAGMLGPGCPPMVCTNGQPRAATMMLLRSLAAAGVPLRHHGDFDWGGLTIGNFLHRRLPIAPCRFDRDAYLRAVASHPHAARLNGAATEASWDAGLAAAMREAGRRIEEELVAGDLLEAFSRSPGHVSS